MTNILISVEVTGSPMATPDEHRPTGVQFLCDLCAVASADDAEGRCAAVLILSGIEGQMRVRNLDAVDIKSLFKPSEKSAAHVPLFQRDGLETAAQNHRRIPLFLHTLNLDMLQDFRSD